MHRSRAVIASLLAAVLIAASATPALGVTRYEYQQHRTAADNARRQAAAAEKTADKLAGDVAQLDKEIESFEAQASALEPKIAAATARTQRILGEVQRLTAEVDLVSQQISDTEAEYARQQKLLSDRIEYTYRQGDWFYFDLLLGSTDIGDLIQRTEFVTRVIQSNNQLAGDLEQTELSLGRSKVLLDRTLASVKLKKREAAAIETDLKALRYSKKQAANQREAAASLKSELMAESRQNAARLLALAEAEEAEARRVASILQARGKGSGIYNGVMLWPVASGSLSSSFGWRIHPIFKTRKFHRGIDISAPAGTAVFAAGNGTVLKADYGWGGGYGNRIWIDHGNGVVTTYNHLQNGSFRVSVGERVRKGDTIARVGSTGYSTGPHLHFEVWVNGEAVNPMTYLQ
jgi:murein DD-endopeptidase MepM/ murein hydrolase activator NlpD